YKVPTVTRREPQSDIHVSLKVYDVLGNKVATLVDEQKYSGNYEVEFNASSLASGIYLYTLIAGSYTETKKMILLR
ncbi:MAG: T9SS type A sorting domain-containing protein, partial [Ignavibacteriaceae bacterium]|nr:T9SS type A sorting domain-containing protein [Ignavibacteriaceae bacterium]